MLDLREGDWVEWTSQSASFVRTKRGVVVQVLGPGQKIQKFVSAMGPDWSVPSSGFGDPRDHQSYLVAQLNNGRIGSRLYWPRVRHLRQIERGHQKTTLVRGFHGRIKRVNVIGAKGERDG